MSRTPWTDAMLQTMRSHYPTMSTRDLAALLGVSVGSVNTKACKLGLRKDAFWLASARRGFISRGGQATQFKPGLVPWNKGRKGWQAGGRSVTTQFATGIEPPNTLPVGSLRIINHHRGKQLERKVSTARGPNHVRWKAVHRLVWEAVHGPTPPGHIVIFRPGMKTLVEAEITIDKVECISRAENARRNHPRNASPEMAKLCQLKGAITRQVNRIQREHNERTAL